MADEPDESPPRRLSRRDFVGRAAKAGIVLPSVSMLLAACESDGSTATEHPDPEGEAIAPVLASTPPMGWNSWNAFGEDINEDKVIATADAMVASGMRDAGWQYVMIDDGWQKNAGPRDEYELDYDPVKFPGGITAVADYVHERGMKLGIYSGPGLKTCAGFTGSAGHEREDADLFASWGVDHLKYDSCCSPGEGSGDVIELHRAMADALRDTGRDIVLHICHCGWDAVWTWAREAGGQHWRIGQDICDDFSVPGHREGYYFDILDMIDRGVGLESYSGPGGWNDFDMLVVNLNGEGALVGDGATPREYRTHFSMWAILASPLIVGSDLSTMDATTIETLTNKEVIALNQDPLGIQASRVRRVGGMEIFVKELQDGARGVAVLNRGPATESIELRWQDDLGLDAGPASVRDLWAHENVGQFDSGYSVEVASHEAVMLRVSQ